MVKFKSKMKKLLILLLLCAACVVSHAQTSLLSRYSVNLDTVTNTGLKSMTTLRTPGVAQNVTVSTVNTLLTGTLAGIARLWGSLDGINYSRIRSTQLQGQQVDSLLVDPNHRVYHWVVEKSPYQYYQVQTTGVGTVTFTVKGFVVAH